MMFTTKNGIRLAVKEVDLLKRARHVLRLIMKHADTDLSADASIALDGISIVIEKTDYTKKGKE
jgi:hypothetical protein